MASARAKELLRTFPIGSPSEEDEQIALFELIEMHRQKWPELGLIYHVPNGGKRGKREAGRFKAMGVRAGVPDVVVPIPSRGYAALYIEMKSKDGPVRKEQKAFLLELHRVGNFAVVCRSAEEAWGEIRHYLQK